MVLNKKCIVDPNLYSDYKFDDLLWFNDPQKRPAYEHLARNCILTSAGSFLVRNPDDTWAHCPNTASATSALYNLWSSSAAVIITNETVRGFIKDGLIVFGQPILIPNGPEFVRFGGERRLNIWRDDRESVLIPNVELEKSFDIFKLIHGAICGNEEDLTFDELMKELNSNNLSEFRWVCHWIANMYQNVGYRIQTNLWLVGESQGIGKGTLVRLIKSIIGRDFCGQANMDEFSKGWTDSIANKLFIEADEFKDDNKRNFVRTIKKLTTNLEPEFAKRNVGQVKNLNFAYWIFTTNEKKPIAVENNNRRDTFVATTSNEKKWSAFSSRINRQMNSKNYAEEIAAFAQVLADLDVNINFIDRALDTDLKESLKIVTRSGQEALLYEIQSFDSDDPATKIAAWYLQQFGQPEVIGYIKMTEFNQAIKTHCEASSPHSVRTWLSAGLEMNIDDLFKNRRVSGGMQIGKSLMYDLQITNRIAFKDMAPETMIGDKVVDNVSDIMTMPRSIAGGAANV